MEEEEPEQEEGKENIQQIVTELRQSQQEVENLQSQVEILSSSLEEVEVSIETVEGIEDFESGQEILVPIGSGSYVPAEIKDPERILSELGADLVAEKNPEEVKKLLEKRKSDFEDSLEQTRERMEELREKIEELRPKAQRLMAQAQAAQEE